ncbi:MAG: phenylalanine--tRNA ligase subunit beta [Nanoarchaeota archaeon]
MAVITFSRKQFEKEVGKLDEEMQEKIAMFGTPLENFDNNEIQIEVFPNRPDLLSYHGFKRAFLAFLGKKTGLKEYKINKPEKDYKVSIESSVKDIRPFTACAIVKGLKLDDEKIKEIIEIQEKLHSTLGRNRKKIAIGIYPLEKINLPIIYKALEPDKIKFIPLEYEKEMSGFEILQKHPTGREYAPLLSGKTKFPVFIDSDKNILSMPPVINSQMTGKITEKTKDVFVECSGFDFEVLKKCLNIVVTCLGDMGGEIYQVELTGAKKENTPDIKTKKMKISLENTNKLLGLDLDEKHLKNLIERMGHNYSKKEVESPSWRTDLLHEVDLIEEVAIAYGYEKFVPEIPKISVTGVEDKKEIIKRKISEILSGVGMLEISNFHLTTEKDQFTKMGFPEKVRKKCVEIENSKTDYTILRKDLLHYILKIFSENIDSEYPQKIFESGKIFDIDSSENIIEEENLAAAVSPGDFTQIKQILDYLFSMINIKIELKEESSKDAYTPFIEGRVASIFVEGEKIGLIGEIHPKILKNLKIKMPVAIFEISLEKVFRKI